MYAPYTNLQFLAVFLHFRVRPIPSPYGRCAVGVILEGTPTATEITNHLIINALPKTIAVGVPPIWTPTAAGLADDEGGAKRGGAGTEGGGVKCNMLILSWLHKRGVSKTDTPLLRNRLYFNILHFTLDRERSRDHRGRCGEKKVEDAGGLIKTRDCFCLCAFTSLRYSDMANLKRTDIEGDTMYITTVKTCYKGGERQEETYLRAT